MAKFLNLASQIYSRVFPQEPDSVLEVKAEDYRHYELVSRELGLFLHSYADSIKNNFEIILYKEHQPKSAFSIYRSTDSEESQIRFLRLKDKIPNLSVKLGNSLTASILQEICRYINRFPSQNLAHICAHFGFVDCLIDLTNENEQILNSEDDLGRSPLVIAIEAQRLNVIQAILSNPNLNYRHQDKMGNNIFHYATGTTGAIVSTICSSLRSAEIPIEELINKRNKSNFTPLYIACFSDNPACAKELLKNGADVNGASIEEAGPTDTNALDDQLLNKLNPQDMKNGGTPLHWCRSVQMIETMVEKNCNLNARNFAGDTALHKMVERVDLNCTISLLSYGADVNLVGANGNTPLHLAVKANNLALVQALIVFGAKPNCVNSNQDTPRHLAATSNQSPAKDTILFVLNSVHATRCFTPRSSCSAGCAPDGIYIGVPPENLSTERNPFFNRTFLKDVIQNNLENKSKSSSSKRKKVKILCMDGGGIRGLILIQILFHLETMTGKSIPELFDWIAGTSTGGILALLLVSGYSASDCRNLYFRLKDKIFQSYFRPYCSETLEKFLQEHLGPEKRMLEIQKPKVMVTATLADRFPPDVQFFRNYPSPDEVLGLDLGPVNTRNEYLWKVARASGAAPTYFSQFECYLDGGLISNNPTLDLLTEIQHLNQTYLDKGDESEVVDISLVVSAGTGIIPGRPIEKLNFSPLFSISGLTNFATSVPLLVKVLVEQASQANGRVVDRAQAWCSMINVPYFRLNPILSDDISIDESDNVKLVQMLWETVAYIYENSDDLSALLNFLE